MAYTPYHDSWENYPDTTTPITAAALEYIEQGIVAATSTGAGVVAYSGSGAPSDSIGANGDFYLDQVNSDLYGPKASGAWPAATSLQGADGAAGQLNAYQIASSVSISAVSPTYSADFAPSFVLVDTTSGSRTVSLPGAGAYAAHQWIFTHWKGGNTCTIDTSGSETIDGANSVTVPAGGTTIVMSDGTNFQIVSERA